MTSKYVPKKLKSTIKTKSVPEEKPSCKNSRVCKSYDWDLGSITFGKNEEGRNEK